MDAVGDGRDQGDEVQQRRDAMQLTEPPVQSGHLIRVRRRVVAALAVLLLCTCTKRVRSRYVKSGHGGCRKQKRKVEEKGAWEGGYKRTLGPPQRRDLVGGRQQVEEVDEAGGAADGQGREHGPAVRGLEDAAEPAGRREPAPAVPRVRQREQGRPRRLDPEVPGEHGPLQHGELRPLEHAEGFH